MIAMPFILPKVVIVKPRIVELYKRENDDDQRHCLHFYIVQLQSGHMAVMLLILSSQCGSSSLR